MSAAVPHPAGVARLVLAAIAGALGGALITARVLAPAPLASSAPTASSAAVPVTQATSAAHATSAPPATSAAPALDVRARAAAGDLDALKQLELGREAERSLDDALAIARGHTALAARDLDALARAIASEPALAHDRATLARLHDFVEREPLTLDALAVVARLPGPESADLLHAVWLRRKHTTVGLLARDLGRGAAARAAASPALEAAIALEELLDARPREGRCAKVRAVVEHIVDDGDRRCTALLARVVEQRGCGADGGADCFPCLRDDDLLGRAQGAAGTREAPTPWILPRR